LSGKPATARRARRALATRAAAWLWVLALVIPAARAADAAREGELDQSSLVTIELSLNILPTIQISRVDDITLTIADRSVDASYAQDICIKGNTGDGYTIAASGTGTLDGRFTLQGAGGEALPFEVRYRPADAAAEFVMAPERSSPQFALQQLQFDCLRDLSSLSVLFRAADLQAVSPGLYTGALKLVVSPI
jgi:hypothetical protein